MLVQSRGDISTAPPKSRPLTLDQCLPYVEVMAKTVWKKYGHTLAGYLEFNDLYHYGVSVMYEIADNYDPSRGASFRTYIGNRVYGAMLDMFYDDPAIPIYKPTKTPEVTPRMGPVSDAEIRQCSVEQKPVDTKLHSTILATLYPREVEIIYLRYYEDVTLTEIGNRLGVTEGRVHQLHDKIIPKLKKRLVYPSIVTRLSNDVLVAKMIARRRRRNEQAQRQFDYRTALLGGVPRNIQARSIRRDCRRRAATSLRAT